MPSPPYEQKSPERAKRVSRPPWFEELPAPYGGRALLWVAVRAYWELATAEPNQASREAAPVISFEAFYLRQVMEKNTDDK
jgi:hypothetical protein